MSDHRRVIAVSRHSRLLFAALLALAIVGCGPTANALRPTLPLRSGQPGSTLEPDGSASGGHEPVEPAASGTPPPQGIAVPMTSFPQGPAYEVTGVAVTPTGYVAVGFAGTGQGYFGLHQGVVWNSSDGSAWQQSLDPAFLDVSPTFVVALGTDIYLFGLFATCSDVFGDTGDLGNEGDINSEGCTENPNAGNVVFRSSSGGPWEQLAQTTDIIHAEIDGVRVWDSTLVAWGAGADDNGTTTIWTSKDALNWTPATDLAGLDPVDTVGVGGPGLVGFAGEYVDTIQDTQLIGASSSDGIRFTSTNVPKVTGASIVDVVSGPGGMAGIGWAASDTTPSLGMSVFSADGTNWTQTNASDGSFDNSLINDIHSSSTEYVAVGSTISEIDMTLQTGRVWVSADGQAWRSLGDYGGLFSQYGDSAIGPDGLLIFTEDEQDSDDTGTDVKSTIYGWIVPAVQLGP